MLVTPTAPGSVTRTVELEIGDVSPEPSQEVQRFALVVHLGDSVQAVRLWSNVPVVLGRDFPAEVRLGDPGVSRQHARFVVQDGAPTVQDLDSRNGTFLNGTRVVRATALRPGDEVRVGSAVIGIAATRGADLRPPEARFVIRNAAMIELYAVAERAAGVDAPVLVLGETGSGKEHVARTIHAHGPRSQRPFVPVNCGALPENLAASLLFGHERGAFTGADRSTKGFFEEAAGGVLFLDEIGDLPIAAQATLLRSLETKRILKVGARRELETDVRLVAATHCDLSEMAEDGTFRRDLLYRINAITLEVPPLRDRPDEIQPLIESFIEDTEREWGTKARGIEPAALAVLLKYEWPGNIRQLRHVTERAALVSPGPRLREEDLPKLPAPRRPSTKPEQDPEVDLKSSLHRHRVEVIRRALRRTGGNREAAAKLLRVPIRTLYRQIKDLDLDGADSLDAPASCE